MTLGSGRGNFVYSGWSAARGFHGASKDKGPSRGCGDLGDVIWRSFNERLSLTLIRFEATIWGFLGHGLPWRFGAPDDRGGFLEVLPLSLKYGPKVGIVEQGSRHQMGQLSRVHPLDVG